MDSLRLCDEHGTVVDMPSLWRDRRILLVFLRHFGCRFCKQQVHAVKMVHDQLRESGTEVVIVSLGTPEQIGRFRADVTLPESIEVYVDPEPDTPVAYAAFKLRSSRDFVVGHPRVAELGAKALEEGFRDGGYPTADGAPYTGDVFQVGGVFVLGQGNTCDYAFRSSYAGDHPNPSDLLEAATGLRADGSEFTYPTTARWLDRLSAGQAAPDSTVQPPPMQLLRSLAALVGVMAVLLPLVALFDHIVYPPPPPPPPPSGSPIGSLFRQLSGRRPPSSPLPPAATWTAWSLASSLALHSTAFKAITLAAPLSSLVLALAVHLLQGTRRAALSDGRGAKAAATHAQAASPDAASVPLLSMTEVDALALTRQLVTCDCSRVTDGTDMLTPSHALSSDELVGIDTLSTLDALGALASSGEPHTPTRAKVSNFDLHQLRLAGCYMREFLSRPHPLLGRSGPTCPFVPKALKLDSMRAAVLRCGPRPSAEAMHALVRGFIPRFERLEPHTGPTLVFKAIVLLFPDVPLENAAEVIDGTQRALKAEFVARGLMLGEFHLKNNSTGLHNAAFYPLRTVCPSLAIRHMVPQDLVFLTGDQYSRAQCIGFLQSYLNKVSGAKGAKVAADVAHARELLKQFEGSDADR